MTEPKKRIPWGRLLGEAVLIIGSVYTAIVIAGIEAYLEQHGIDANH